MIVRVLLVGRVSPRRQSRRQRRDQALLRRARPAFDTLKEDIDLAALASAFLTPEQAHLLDGRPLPARARRPRRPSWTLTPLERAMPVNRATRERTPDKGPTAPAPKRDPLWCDTCHTRWTEAVHRKWARCPFVDCKGTLTDKDPRPPATPEPKVAPSFPLFGEEPR